MDLIQALRKQKKGKNAGVSIQVSPNVFIISEYCFNLALLVEKSYLSSNLLDRWIGSLVVFGSNEINAPIEFWENLLKIAPQVEKLETVYQKRHNRNLWEIGDHKYVRIDFQEHQTEDEPYDNYFCPVDLTPFTLDDDDNIDSEDF